MTEKPKSPWADEGRAKAADAHRAAIALEETARKRCALPSTADILDRALDDLAKLHPDLGAEGFPVFALTQMARRAALRFVNAAPATFRVAALRTHNHGAAVSLGTIALTIEAAAVTIHALCPPPHIDAAKEKAARDLAAAIERYKS